MGQSVLGGQAQGLAGGHPVQPEPEASFGVLHFCLEVQRVSSLGITQGEVFWSLSGDPIQPSMKTIYLSAQPQVEPPDLQGRWGESKRPGATGRTKPRVQLSAQRAGGTECRPRDRAMSGEGEERPTSQAGRHHHRLQLLASALRAVGSWGWGGRAGGGQLSPVSPRYSPNTAVSTCWPLNKHENQTPTDASRHRPLNTTCSKQRNPGRNSRTGAHRMGWTPPEDQG